MRFIQRQKCPPIRLRKSSAPCDNANHICDIANYEIWKVYDIKYISARARAHVHSHTHAHTRTHAHTVGTF